MVDVLVVLGGNIIVLEDEDDEEIVDLLVDVEL